MSRVGLIDEAAGDVQHSRASSLSVFGGKTAV